MSDGEWRADPENAPRGVVCTVRNFDRGTPYQAVKDAAGTWRHPTLRHCTFKPEWWLDE